MQLNHSNFTSHSSGALETQAFGVNFDATLAYSLMSGIAKDKIRYPVREIGTNAYDANPNHPFDVQLPTLFDQTFRVRDYGPGLSHAQIMSVYTTFGGSLKRESNDQVGGLGLGSKSPFAYLISCNTEGAASFTVRSFHDGKIHTYIMSLAPNGMPECRYFGANPATPATATGLEVSFVVDRADIPSFYDAVKEIYWHFPTKPKITNIPDFTFSPANPISSNSSTPSAWTLYDPSAPFDTPHVRMGCVAYPINIDLIDPTFPFSNSPIVFEAPIGSLSFTTSREELGYDTRTVSQLSSSLDQFLKEYAVNIQTQIDDPTTLTYLDACKVFRKLFFNTPAINVLNQRRLISYKGRPLRSSFTGTKAKWNVTILHNLAAPVFAPNGHGSRHDKHWEISLDNLNFKSVVYSRSSSYSALRLQKLNPPTPILWIRPRDSSVSIEDIIEQWDLSSYSPVNLDKVKIKSDRTLTSSSQKLNIRSLPYLNDSADVCKERHNLNDGGVYIIKTPTSRRSRTSYNDGFNSKGVWEMRRMFDFIKPSLSPDSKLWIFNQDTLPENQNQNWVPLATAVKATLEPLVDLDAIKVRQSQNKLPYGFEKYAALHPFLDTTCVEKDFVDFCAQIARISTSKSTPIDENMQRYLKWFPASQEDAGDLASNLTANLDSMFNKYPLLRLIVNQTSRWNVSDKDVAPLNHYFSLLNK